MTLIIVVMDASFYLRYCITLEKPYHGRLQAQARRRLRNLQERLKKRLSKSISVGGCSSTNSPKRLD